VIRVNAQLIDGKNGLERWSQNYDRTPGDAIKIQSDIAENVARTLSIALGAANGGSLTVGGTQNAKAHDLALKADEAFERYTKEDVDRSLNLLDEAIRLAVANNRQVQSARLQIEKAEADVQTARSCLTAAELDELASTETCSAMPPTRIGISIRVTMLIGTLTPVCVYGLNPLAVTDRS